MNTYRFYINDTEIFDAPEGWEDFVEEWEFDEEIFGLIPGFPATLTFTNDGYVLIRSLFEANGYCDVIDFRADEICNGNTTPGAVQGKIFLSDVRYDLKQCSAEVEITDERFGAKIENNKSIKATVDTPKGKNNLDITAAVEIAITPFNPTTGTTVGIFNTPGTTRKAYDVKEVLTFLVSFMTDGEVGFVSDWYDDLPADEKLCLMMGKELRIPITAADVPVVSFTDVITNLHWKYDVWFTLERTPAGGIDLRLEEFEFFRTTLGEVEFKEPPTLRLGFETDKLYGGIEIGSEEFIKDTLGLFSLPYVPFLTHVVEDYVVTGECNTDNILNLVTEFVYCNNAIEEALVNNGKSRDDDVFLIQYTPTGAGTGDATQGFYLTEPAVLPALYNEQLLNTNVSARFALSGELAKFFGVSPDADKFRAERTTDGVVTIDPTDSGLIASELLVPFQDDFTPPNIDLNGNWSVVLFEYAAPATGFYRFSVEYFWRIFTSLPGNLFPGNATTEQFKSISSNVTFNRTDAGSVPIFSFTSDAEVQDAPNPTSPDPYKTKFTQGIFMQATDLLKVSATFVTSATATTPGVNPEISFGAVRGSFVLTDYISTGGGIFEAKDADQYFVGIYELDDVLNALDWDKINDNPALGFPVICGDINDTAFIKKISRKRIDGETTAALSKNFETS